MNKLLLFFVAVLCSLSVMAQPATCFNYSCQVKDASGNLLQNAPISVRATFKLTTSSVATYVETHSVNTDADGLFRIVVGTGTVASSQVVKSLDELDWGSTSLKSASLMIEIDPDGEGYSISGETQLNPVPFAVNALSARSANTVTGFIGSMPLTQVIFHITDPYNIFSGSFMGQAIKNNASFTVPGYCATYMSAGLSKYAQKVDDTHHDYQYSYTVTINNQPFDNVAGVYQRVGENVYNSFETASVLNAPDGIGFGLMNLNSKVPSSFGKWEYYYANVVDWLADPDKPGLYDNNKDMYENRLYIGISDNDYSNLYNTEQHTLGVRPYNSYASKYATFPYATMMTHESGLDNTAEVFAKIPNFIYKNTFTTDVVYKVGTNAKDLNANMVNQAVGPFTNAVNHVYIVVKREGGTAIIN